MSATSEAVRLERAQSENIEASVEADGETVVVQGDSGRPHVVTVDGGEAVDCTCEDRFYRGTTCKHMQAVNKGAVNRVRQ